MNNATPSHFLSPPFCVNKHTFSFTLSFQHFRKGSIPFGCPRLFTQEKWVFLASLWRVSDSDLTTVLCFLWRPFPLSLVLGLTLLKDHRSRPSISTDRVGRRPRTSSLKNTSRNFPWNTPSFVSGDVGSVSFGFRLPTPLDYVRGWGKREESNSR